MIKELEKHKKVNNPNSYLNISKDEWSFLKLVAGKKNLQLNLTLHKYDANEHERIKGFIKGMEYILGVIRKNAETFKEETKNGTIKDERTVTISGTDPIRDEEAIRKGFKKARDRYIKKNEKLANTSK